MGRTIGAVVLPVLICDIHNDVLIMIKITPETKLNIGDLVCYDPHCMDDGSATRWLLFQIENNYLYFFSLSIHYSHQMVVRVEELGGYYTI